jgi:hypothetical protein
MLSRTARVQRLCTAAVACWKLEEISVLVYGTAKFAKLDLRFSSAVNVAMLYYSCNQQQHVWVLFCEVGGFVCLLLISWFGPLWCVGLS